MMKTEQEIQEEIEARKKYKYPADYGNYRSNRTIINTLRWVLGLSSSVRGVKKDEERI